MTTAKGRWAEDAPFDRRVLSGVVLGGVLAAAMLGPRALPWGLGIAGLAVVWAAWRTWEHRSRDKQLLRGLRATWLELPGARWDRERELVHVFHGSQPIEARMGRTDSALSVAVATPIGDMPTALRIWPAAGPRPSLDPDGLPVGGPPVDPAPHLAEALGADLRAEASDEVRAMGIVDEAMIAALGAVRAAAPGSFAGLTYDGQRLAVHLVGPVVADPERSAQLARALWGPLVGGDSEDPHGASAP